MIFSVSYSDLSLKVLDNDLFNHVAPVYHEILKIWVLFSQQTKQKPVFWQRTFKNMVLKLLIQTFPKIMKIVKLQMW